MSVMSYHKKPESNHQIIPSDVCPASWVWFSAGILFGLFIAFLFYLRDLEPTLVQLAAPAIVTTTIVTVPPVKPIIETEGFKFYDFIPTNVPTNVPVIDAITPAVIAAASHKLAQAKSIIRKIQPELTAEIINRPAQELPPRFKPKPQRDRDEIVLVLPLPKFTNSAPIQQFEPARHISNPLEPVAGLTVQIAAFIDKRDAELLRQELVKLGFKAKMHVATVNNRQWYRVRLLTASSATRAQQLQDRLNKYGYSSILVH